VDDKEMDEDLIIENDGRVVGVAVRVRGGFMFFSSDPDLNELEATVFRRAETIMRRVAEIAQAKRCSGERTVIEAPPSRSATAIDGGGGNVLRLRPKQCHANANPEPPDAA
jgi:hypothetical protein